MSKRLLLLKFIVAEWPGDASERDAAVSVLVEAHERAPDAFTELIRDPMVGSWAAWTSRRIRRTVDSDAPLDADLGHLGSIAAAAATVSGIDAELTTYARRSGAMVPTRGAARLPVPDLAPVRLRVRRGSLEAVGGGHTVAAADPPSVDGPGWDGLRRLAADCDGRRASVAIEDLDPYRDRHHIPAACRVAAEGIARWRETFARAWELLSRYAPDRADELATGLRSIVPLAYAGAGPARSATARDAFGSFGSTAPDSPADFAMTLVHEFQHSKLSALLDLVPLYDLDAPGRFYAPWRRDPRPVGGLLQGVYAFLAVADTWRALREAPGLATAATQEFADLREQVNHALDSVLGSDALTPDGVQFAAGLRAAMDRLMAEPLPPAVVEMAGAKLARNAELWRQRQLRTS